MTLPDGIDVPGQDRRIPFWEMAYGTPPIQPILMAEQLEAVQPPPVSG